MICDDLVPKVIVPTISADANPLSARNLISIKNSLDELDVIVHYDLFAGSIDDEPHRME